MKNSVTTGKFQFIRPPARQTGRFQFEAMILDGMGDGTERAKTASDVFEVEIAENVRKFLSFQDPPYDSLRVEHYEGEDRKYNSDVKIANPSNGKNVWIEVKLNKFSDYGNPSFKYEDGEWTCTTSEEDDPLAGFFLKAISENSERFISFCKDFLGTDDIKLPTDLSPELVRAWKASGSVDDTENDTQFITEKIRINGFGEMISRYYASQKAEPVYYIQIGDDLYLIDRKYNPLDLVTKSGTELRTLSEAHRIGRIQFRMKGIERDLKDGPKQYYSITSDFKVLSDRNLDEDEEPYECSFATEEKWPVVRGSGEKNVGDGTGTVVESRLAVGDKLFFHGSRNESGVLSSIRPPSPEHVFFVTEDLDYAEKYAKGGGDVYVVSLKDGIEIFDPYADMGKSRLMIDRWGWNFLGFLATGDDWMEMLGSKVDLFNFLMDIARNAYRIREIGYDEKAFWDSDFVRDAGPELRSHYMQLFEICKDLSGRKEADDILKDARPNETHSYNWKIADRLRTLFAKDLSEAGYSGFRTEEMSGDATSRNCLGIFDPDAFDSFFTYPIEKTVAKKALEALKDDEDYPYGKNYGKSNDVIRDFAREYLKARGKESGTDAVDESILEAITIPPDKDDEIEMELRRLLRPNEEKVDTKIDLKDIPPAPEGKDPEKWVEWQKASILKKRQKEAAAKRDPFLEKWGDMIIGWYRNHKKLGKGDIFLRNKYIDNFDNLVDLLKSYEEYLNDMTSRKLLDRKVKFEISRKEYVLDPAKDFNLKNIPRPLEAKHFVQAMGEIVGGGSGARYEIEDADLGNIGLFDSSEHVMCWRTRTWKSTNKFIFQLWQNAETLGNGGVFGDPEHQTPYCTHGRSHWNEYARGNPDYTQYWFLEKPEGEFDWTPGDLSNENVRKIFDAIEGKGPELLIAMDDSNCDDLRDRNDEYVKAIEYLAYGDEIDKIDRKMRNAAVERIVESMKSDWIRRREADLGDMDDITRHLIRKIDIPDGVETIAQEAFFGCVGLEEVRLPASLRRIQGYAFSNCRSLKSISIPDGLKSISNDAFRRCESLREVELPRTVEYIGFRAFEDCTGLEKAILRGRLEDIPYGTFMECSRLREVDCSGISSSVVSIGGHVFDMCYRLSNIRLPSGATGIGEYAFRSCTSLKTIDIPRNVSHIDQHAFDYCQNLKEVRLPENLERIGDRAFENCVSLDKLKIPEKVSHIGFPAFDGCQNLHLEFPGRTADEVGSMAGYPWGARKDRISAGGAVSEEEEIGGEKSDRSGEFSSGIKIWIDDLREPPPGFKWFRTAEGAIDWLEENGTEGVSLFDTDHDAGEMFVMGGDYVNVFRWLDRNGKRDITVHIHSANPKGANAIREIISKNKENGWKEIRNRRKKKDVQDED